MEHRRQRVACSDTPGEIRDRRPPLAGVDSQSVEEILGRDAGLFEHASERASFQLAMIRYHATGRTSAKYDVATALTCYRKSQFPQCPYDLCP